MNICAYMRQTSLVLTASLLVMGCSGSRPNSPKEGAMLAPCPSSPNCVSTEASDAKHRIEPIAYEGSKDAAWTRLLKALKGMKRARIVSSERDSIRVEFMSLLWRFVDDAEFRIDDADKTIRFRSASRLGHSDFGANRRRMEAIRKKF